MYLVAFGVFYCIGKIKDFTYTTKHIPHNIALQFWRTNNGRGMKGNLKGHEILIMPLLFYIVHKFIS